MKKILLMGNPNVGKSVIFSRLTGAKVIVSNYPGTTVEFAEGTMMIDGEDIEVIDVPGTYTLAPDSEAEKVAVKLINESSADDTVIVNVIDSTNLERNLNLTLQLLKKRIPMVVALNFWDETSHTGVEIDPEKLSEMVGVKCIPTCGITGEGINKLVGALKKAKIPKFDCQKGEKWQKIGEIVDEVQKMFHRHHRLSEILGELSVKPLTGFPIAGIIAFFTFTIIRFIGEGLIGNVAEPLFETLWKPLMMKLSVILGSGGVFHDIVIGRLIDGGIDFNQSFGLLTTGLFVPLAAVLPYVFSFYLVLSVLEDSGYLPRLAVLLDNAMHKVGLHGFGIVPMLLGVGCNVPGALSSRIMGTKRERFIAMTLMAITIPCMAQIAMVSGLIGKFGAAGFMPVFGTLFLVWIILGIILNKGLKGRSPELFIEIPPYRIPYWGALLKKVWMRVIWFVKEAVPWVLFGVFLINILYTLGVIDFIGNFLEPVISGVLGLPSGAVAALVIGFLRKDVAVGMLVPLDLNLKQLIIASVVLTMYFPCAATFAVMIKELGLKDMLKAALIMGVSTLTVGGILNLIL
ncbi:MAG: FeoB small GTPase domain-containing protein [Elusimicrobiota bacterium]